MFALYPAFPYSLFLFNATATTAIYTLSLHDALPIYALSLSIGGSTIYGPLAAPIALLLWIYLVSIAVLVGAALNAALARSEEHTSELQSRGHLVCRLLLEKKKKCHKLKTRRRMRDAR